MESNNKQPISFESLFKEDAMPTYSVIPSIRIKRLNYGGGRYYIEQDDVQKRLYRSLTTFLDMTDTSQDKYFLNNWRDQLRAELGKQGSDQYMKATADYGTILHLLIGDFVSKGYFDFDDNLAYVYDFFASNGIPRVLIANMVENLFTDFVCFVQFFRETKATVLAVELPCKSEQDHIITLVDLVVEFDYKRTPKAEPKRMKALINIKSGKSFPAHGLQMVGEWRMYNETYEHVFGRIDNVFTLHPKFDRKRHLPKYEVHDYSEKVRLLEPQYLLRVALAKQTKTLNTQITHYLFSGKVSYGESANECMNRITYSTPNHSDNEEED